MTAHNISFRTTTPSFIGGSDPKKSAEFRLASFKGVLRFWWRATQWGKYTEAAELKKAEDAIFGSSDQSVGRSKVRLRLLQLNVGNPLTTGTVLWKDDQPKNVKGNEKRAGAFYLGYGCIKSSHRESDPTKGRAEKKAGQLEKACLLPFEFQLLVNAACIDKDQMESVEQALWVMGHLGGLGAKNRKGFGSLSIVDWNNYKPTWQKDSPDETFQHLMDAWRGRTKWSDEPQWTAFNEHTRIVKVELKDNATDARDLLDRIGREMVRFRSWGNDEMILESITAERRFKEDHDLSKGLRTEISHPKRIVFGMPHNYGKLPKTHVYPDTAPPNSSDEGRRASPLFIHIHHPDPKDKPIAYLAFFPTQFLPPGINIKSFGNPTPVSTTGLYDPIHQFLDRLEGKTPPASDPDNKMKEQLKGTKVL